MLLYFTVLALSGNDVFERLQIFMYSYTSIYELRWILRRSNSGIFFTVGIITLFCYIAWVNSKQVLF